MASFLFAVPFGIVHDFPVANLLGTWSSWYDAPYSDATRSSDVTPDRGDCILMGSRAGEASANLSLAAFGRRDVVLGAASVQENGLYWYRETSLAAGFAPNSVVDLSQADLADPSDTERLSWHLDLGFGGFRSGATRNLNEDNDWRKVVMYGPCVVCGAGFYPGPHACLPCDVGYRSDLGATRCLPTESEAVHASLRAPRLEASLESPAGIRITVHAHAPLAEVYGGASLSYAVDLSATLTLSHDSNCSSLWVQEANTTFSLTLTVPDVGVCSFNMSYGNTSATLSAYVGLFTVAESGLAAPVVTLLNVGIPLSFAATAEGDWGFEQKTIGGVAVAVGAAVADLEVFETKEYDKLSTVLFYKEGDPIFLQMNATGARAASWMELVSLWLSSSDDPEDVLSIRHDLTGAVLPPQKLERGVLKMTFTARLCEVPCYLHCLVSLRDGPGVARSVGEGAGRLLSDAGTLTDKDYSWQMLAIAIQEAEAAAEEIEEGPPALLTHPVLMLGLAVAGACLVFVPRCLYWAWQRLFPGDPPGQAVQSNDTENEQQAQRPHDEDSGYGFFFILESADVALDWAAWFASYKQGELEHSNDDCGILFWGLIVSNIFSSVATVVEFILVNRWGLDDRIKLPRAEKPVRLILGLIYMHLFFEDTFQMWIYTGIAASAWVNDGEYVVSLAGFLQSLVFVGFKVYELFSLDVPPAPEAAQFTWFPRGGGGGKVLRRRLRGRG